MRLEAELSWSRSFIESYLGMEIALTSQRLCTDQLCVAIWFLTWSEEDILSLTSLNSISSIYFHIDQIESGRFVRLDWIRWSLVWVQGYRENSTKRNGWYLQFTMISFIYFQKRALLVMIAHSAVQSTRTLFTMLFCPQTPQCLIHQSSFSNWEAIFGDNC